MMPIRWGFQLLLSEEYDLIIQSYKDNNRDMGTFKDVESVIGFLDKMGRACYISILYTGS